MNIPQQELFEEFVQFAYNEMILLGWRERLNELRNCDSGYFNIYRHEPNCYKSQACIIYRKKRMEMTIPECVEENGDFEKTMMNIFRNDLDEHHWFKSWFQKYHTELYNSLSYAEKYNLGDGRSEFGCEFNDFIEGLTFEKMMEIINSDISLK